MKLLIEVIKVQQLQKLFMLWHKSCMSLLRLEIATEEKNLSV